MQHAIQEQVAVQVAIVDPSTRTTGWRTVAQYIDPELARETIRLNPRLTMRLQPVRQESGVSLTAHIETNDGQSIHLKGCQSVTAIFENVDVETEENPCEVHLKCSHEGLIADLWASRQSSLDENLGSLGQEVPEIVARLQS